MIPCQSWKTKIPATSRQWLRYKTLSRILFETSDQASKRIACVSGTISQQLPDTRIIQSAHSTDSSISRASAYRYLEGQQLCSCGFALASARLFQMATIEFDSELLRQPLPQKTLANALDFRAVQDFQSNTIVFSIHKDGSLLLLAGNGKGTTKLINISKQLGVQSPVKVQALAVSQAKNLDIYTAFATADGKNASNLWVLSPLSPTTESWYDSINVNSIFLGKQSSTIVISKLLLVRPFESFPHTP